MSSATEVAVARRGRLRGLLFLSASILVVVAGLANYAAELALRGGPGPAFGPLRLQLVYNPGVAFGLGGAWPTWAVITVTGAITLAVAGYSWRAAPATGMPSRIGLTAILAGAAANLLDRLAHGVVTDYFHTEWFATFNLADVFITCGATLVVVAALAAPPGRSR